MCKSLGNWELRVLYIFRSMGIVYTLGAVRINGISSEDIKQAII